MVQDAKDLFRIYSKIPAPARLRRRLARLLHEPPSAESPRERQQKYSGLTSTIRGKGNEGVGDGLGGAAESRRSGYAIT